MVFIFSLFFLKTKTQYKNEAVQEIGLTYGNEIIVDLINKDSDGDGVPDWEENLWGTDPTKKISNQGGVEDGVYINKIKAKVENNSASVTTKPTSEENLTQTDKFSRELFSTIAALNQNGSIDQATIDKLSSSLSEQIKNAPARKIYGASEIKIINEDSKEAAKNYNDKIEALYKKYQIKGSALGVLKESIVDENNINVNVLSKLDPIIKQTSMIINGTAKMEVPRELALLHLDLINVLQRLTENLSDIKLFDSDVIVALSAMSQYQKNTDLLQTATSKLTQAIDNKLSN